MWYLTSSRSKLTCYAHRVRPRTQGNMVFEQSQLLSACTQHHSVIHILNRWDVGHNLKMMVHFSIESTPDTDLWAIWDKIGVLCGPMEQATWWLSTRAWLKTTQGASIFHLRPSVMSNAWWRNGVTLRLYRSIRTVKAPQGPRGKPTKKNNFWDTLDNNSGGHSWLVYMVDL